MNSSPEHILILGPSKTGTTGLYTAVKEGLVKAGLQARTLFEPMTSDPVDSMFLHAPSTRLMIKVTMDRIHEVVPDVRAFEHRVMTVRDPRDVLVSSLLFRPLTRQTIDRVDPSAVQKFVAALEEKEADPSAHSVRGLFTLAQTLGIGRPPYQELTRVLDHQLELLAAGLVHVVRYEKFVQDDLQDLSKELGFEVGNAAAGDDSWIGHITRSRSSGEFTRWFLEEDLDFFNDLYGEHLRTFGYDLNAAIERGEGIDPATSSQYVRHRYSIRRSAFVHARQVPWTPEDVDSPEGLRVLMERAQDGNRTSCLRLARVLINGHLGPKDPAGALDWARFAAQMGEGEGRALTIRLLELLDPSDAALRRELRGWQVEAQLTRNQPSTSPRLRRLRSGVSYAVRHPAKATPKVMGLLRRGLARLRRS
jgi:hypothetical protein